MYESTSFKCDIKLDMTKYFCLMPIYVTLTSLNVTELQESLNLCSHYVIKWQIVKAVAVVYYVREMTREVLYVW